MKEIDKYKSFRDTVHGYITIREDYCKRIVDTINFQRLRRVEQTSARVLYPCARHDRFIHSLGVYFIGSRIFEHLKERCISDYKEDVASVEWEKIRITYEIACLLHDCGHSPFSHTFEKYYDYKTILNDELINTANDACFEADLMQQSEASPHEKVSAIILLKIYGNTIDELGGDKIMAARMIIGCKYLENHIERSLDNCFISLLHGRVVDADRIDYVCRDKWASGYNSISLEVDRLINAMFLNREESGLFTICYDKRALTEIQNVLDVKNFQQLWVINHHKVIYDQDLFDKAITKLAELLCPEKYKESPRAALAKLFNYKAFLEPVKVGEQSLYMPSDDDIIYLLKLYLSDNEYAKEWFSREHRMIPLWKTTAEFIALFSDCAHSDSLSETGWLFKYSKKEIDDYLDKKGFSPNKSLIINSTPKPKIIGKNEIAIRIKEHSHCYTKLNMPSQQFPIKFFFYIYIPIEAKADKDDIIVMLQEKLKSLL